MDDEKRQMSILICSLIQRVDYGRDFEKQLSFYVETRASFANLDSVHMQLVQVIQIFSLFSLQNWFLRNVIERVFYYFSVCKQASN